MLPAFKSIPAFPPTSLLSILYEGHRVLLTLVECYLLILSQKTKQISLRFLFYFLHDRIFCFHLQPLQLPRIFTPCGLSRHIQFNSLPLGPSPRLRIPSFSFPLLSCILQGPSPYIAAAAVTKGTGTSHAPAATVTAAEHLPSSNDNSMTSDTLLRQKRLEREGVLTSRQ